MDSPRQAAAEHDKMASKWMDQVGSYNELAVAAYVIAVVTVGSSAFLETVVPVRGRYWTSLCLRELEGCSGSLDGCSERLYGCRYGTTRRREFGGR
jgi:hypothetical protein